jgi:hypothetical protein
MYEVIGSYVGLNLGIGGGLSFYAKNLKEALFLDSIFLFSFM